MVALTHQHDEAPLLAAALAYAARGWYVFPLHTPDRNGRCDCRDEACASPGKHPWTPNGLKAATTHEGQIRAWWSKWPHANIGIACGPSGLTVLDVDPRHGGDAALGELARRAATARGDRLATPLVEQLVGTLTSATGGGGWHYVYQAPRNGAAIRNKHNLDGLDGLDVRGVGGYIVAPPSRHANDAQYLWQTGRDTGDGATGAAGYVPADPAPIPAWLLEVLTRAQTATQQNQPPAPPMRVLPDGGGRRDPKVWLDRALATAREGNRNATGFWLACQLRDDGVSRADAEGYLLAYAVNVGAGQKPYTEAEALRSLTQAYSRPAREEARSQAAVSSRPLAVTQPPARVQSSHEPHAAESAPTSPTASPTALPQRRYRFLTDEEVEQMPPPAWLIGGFLVADTLAVLYGEFGTYKSFLALDWALCVATGSAWHGQPVKQGPVVYVAGEGLGGLGKRIRAWKLAHGWTGGSVPIHLLGEAPQFLRAADVGALQEAIADLSEPPALIIVDTLARSLVGGDENSAMDMGLAVAAAESLRTATGATVALIHHKPKGANGTRGSSALPGAVYTSIEVIKEDARPNVITIRCEKQKDWEHFDNRRLCFEVRALDEEGRQTSGILIPDETPIGQSQAPRLPPAAKRVLSILLASSGLTWAALKERFVDQYGMSLSSLNRGLEILETAGLAENVSGFWRATEQ